jgi:hypothetical protein
VQFGTSENFPSRANGKYLSARLIGVNDTLFGTSYLGGASTNCDGGGLVAAFVLSAIAVACRDVETGQKTSIAVVNVMDDKEMPA